MFIDSTTAPQIHKKPVPQDVGFKYGEIDQFIFKARTRQLVVDYNFGNEKEVIIMNGESINRLIVLHSHQFVLSGIEFETFYSDTNTQSAMGQVMALIINTCIVKGFLQGTPSIGLDWSAIPTKPVDSV